MNRLEFIQRIFIQNSGEWISQGLSDEQIQAAFDSAKNVFQVLEAVDGALSWSQTCVSEVKSLNLKKCP